MTNRHITYRGHDMSPDWPARIRAAQRQKTVSRDGVSYPRIPYGQEAYCATIPEEPYPTCGDCGVIPGELHVECCDMESCPICVSGQWLLCRMGKCRDHFERIAEDIDSLPETTEDVYAPKIVIPDTQLPLL
jgi:hypothetical protein